MKRLAMMMATAVLATAQAQTYWWDAGGTQNGDPSRQREDGSGAWDLAGYLWRTNDVSGGLESDYVQFVSGDWVEARFGYAGSGGDAGTVTLAPGLSAYAVRFNKPYTFTGGPIVAPLNGMIIQNNGADSDPPAVFDVEIVAADSNPGATMNIGDGGTGSIIFTKPHIGDYRVSLRSPPWYTFFGLSGKEARFMTGYMINEHDYAFLRSDGALNAARVMPNDIGGLRFNTPYLLTDRFVVTGDYIGNKLLEWRWGLGTFVLEGALAADEIILVPASNGYIYLNGASALDSTKTVQLGQENTGTIVLGHPDALGDAQIRMVSTVVAWAPGVTAEDISGRITPDSRGNLAFNVGTQNVVFTNAFAMGASALGMRGKPGGSLTLRPPTPLHCALGNLWGGTLVLDFADIPPVDGVASNMLGVSSSNNHIGRAGTLHIKGKPTADTTIQDIRQFDMGSTYVTMVVESCGGAETILHSWGSGNYSPHGVMEIILMDANAHFRMPAPPWWHCHTVRTPDGRWHYLDLELDCVLESPLGEEGNETPYYRATGFTNYMELTSTYASGTGRSLKWSGLVELEEVGGDIGDTFKVEALEEDCILDLNGRGMRVNNMLVEGDYDTTIKNGILYHHSGYDAGRFFIYGDGTLTLGPDLTVSSERPFVKTGSGTLRILGSLGLNQLLNFNNGKIEIGHSESLGLVPASRSLNAEIRIQGDVTIAALSDNLDIGRNIWFDYERTLTMDVQEGMTLTLSGIINGTEGSGGIRKVGGGTLVLANEENTYAYGTELLEGTLSVGSMKALGHPSLQGLTFSGGVLQITGMECDTIDTVYVDNWGAFDGGFDIVEAGNAFVIGSPVTVKAGGVFAKAGEGTLVMEGGLTVGAGTLRVVGSAEHQLGNGGI
ncbi:MAG: hypothetical protein FWF84_05265, partial [Kiritimatiellaeota bacterium]|nr:hypothetical protein [Kiritimatiellota bacterium]